MAVKITDETPKWDRLLSLGVRVITRVTRYIEGSEVVSKQDLMDIWGKNKRSIERYIKDGMPQHINSSTRFQLFDLEKCETWRDGTIDKSQSGKTEKSPSVVDHPEDISTEEVRRVSDMSRRYTAEANDAELKVQLNQIKLDEAIGRLVDADDLDKAMAEQAVIHKTDKTNDEKILPILLENKSSAEIATILHEHQQERLNMLDKLINKKFEGKATMYDIVEQSLELLSYDVEPDEIIKRMRDES